MKNLFLLLALGFAMMAHASTYNYLVFTNAAGTHTAFGVNNLTLTINGSNLQVTNSDESVNLILTDLKSMQFSSDGLTTSLENVLNMDEPVEVFSVSGASVGMYSSLLDAVQNLNAGAYVISNGSIKQTIVVK